MSLSRKPPGQRVQRGGWGRKKGYRAEDGAGRKNAEPRMRHEKEGCRAKDGAGKKGAD